MELQKVYVPVDVDDFVLDKESLSVPVISGGGMVSQQFTFDANNLKGKGYKILKETDAILLSREDAEKIKAVIEKAQGMCDPYGNVNVTSINNVLEEALQILNK